jgi:hypothetical protein
MKYFYTLIVACLLLQGGCINLPDPEFPGDKTANVPDNEIAVYIDEVATVSGANIVVTASMSASSYNGKSADGVGIYANNVEYTGIITSNRTTFTCSFHASANVTYSIRAYAKFGSQYFYSDYRQASLSQEPPQNTSFVSECLALSDGLYYYFNPPSNTDAYYFKSYTQSGLPSSDNAIINDLLINGVRSEVIANNNFNEGYTYDLTPNTTYTLCVLMIDKQGRQTLEKKNLTTKSTTNQPVAAINVSSVTYSGVIYYTTTKSGTCASYVLTGFYDLSSQSLDYPDIYWASECYDDYKASENIYIINLNNSWSGWSGRCVVVSLGFTSGGVNGGVISKQFFSTTTGSLITASVPYPTMIRSAQEQPKTPKTAKTTSKRKFNTNHNSY